MLRNEEIVESAYLASPQQEWQFAAGREPFQHAIQAALSRWHLDEPNL